MPVPNCYLKQALSSQPASLPIIQQLVVPITELNTKYPCKRTGGQESNEAVMTL